MSENETNLPLKVPKLKLMDMDRETDGEEVVIEATSEAVGAIAHKKSTYPFDPSKEPLLQDNPRRFVIFPIEYTDIWKMYKKVSKQTIKLKKLQFPHKTWSAKFLAIYVSD